MVDNVVYYIRDDKKRPIGVLYAKKVADDRIKVGWSKCNVRCDVFDKKKGRAIAEGRALTGSNMELPRDVAKRIDAFCERAAKYFKVAPELVGY
jgi:hypothetical protein